MEKCSTRPGIVHESRRCILVAANVRVSATKSTRRGQLCAWEGFSLRYRRSRPPSPEFAEVVRPSSQKPFYRGSWSQGLVAVAIAVAFGYLKPHNPVAMNPLGDAFIRLIGESITLVIFC